MADRDMADRDMADRDMADRGMADRDMADRDMADRGMEDDEGDMVELATRLFGFARDGLTEELAAYLDAGVPANLTNQRGDSLVMLAAYHGHADTVVALLARGADPDRPNDRGQTPLAGAVFKAEKDVIRALVAGGADPEAGRPSATGTAALFGREDLSELLRPADTGG